MVSVLEETGKGAGWSKPRLVVGSAGQRRERNKQREDGTGGRVNEPPGMDGRKSERPIVPMSPGNRTSRDPEEGRGRQGMEPVEGKMARALNLARVLTRLHRIAELACPAGARRSAAAQRTHAPEEPDAGIPHVRICGGPGRVTARVYPTPMQHAQLYDFGPGMEGEGVASVMRRRWLRRATRSQGYVKIATTGIIKNARPHRSHAWPLPHRREDR